MKRLDRYLTLEFVKIYSLSAVGLIIIGLVEVVVDDLGDYLHSGYTLFEIFRSFLWMVPVIFVQFSPLAVLIAVLIGLGLMGKYKETLALEGSGLNPVRFLSPYFWISIFIGAACFFVNETLVPISYGKIKPQPQITGPTLVLPGFFLYADNFVTQEATFHHLNILLFQKEGSLKEVYQAEKGRILEDTNWLMKSGRRVSFSPDGQVIEEDSFQTRMVNLGFSPQEVAGYLRPTETLSWRQLSDYLKKLSAAGMMPPAVKTTALSHFSYPLLNTFVIFLAFPLLFSRRFARPILITFGFLLAIFTYWFFSFSLALGKEGYLSPEVAVFLPHLTILAAAAFFHQG